MSKSSSSGPAIDAQGRNVADPSANVNALTAAAVERLNDLRDADNQRHDDALAHIKEMAELRAKHAHELGTKESERIDAIRAVDVAAVISSARDAAVVAATLASQVTTSADTLRNQVELTKTAAAGALTTALEPIQKDIAELRKVQYEQAGQRTGNPDLAAMTHALKPLTDAITALQLSQSNQQGHTSGADDYRQNRRASLGTIIASVTGFVSAAGVIITLIIVFH